MIASSLTFAFKRLHRGRGNVAIPHIYICAEICFDRKTLQQSVDIQSPLDHDIRLVVRTSSMVYTTVGFAVHYLIRLGDGTNGGGV